MSDSIRDWLNDPREDIYSTYWFGPWYWPTLKWSGDSMIAPPLSERFVSPWGKGWNEPPIPDAEARP